MLAAIHRLMNLGITASTPEGEVRHRRTTTVMALLGAAIMATWTPAAAAGGEWFVAMENATVGCLFLGCLWSNRGNRPAVAAFATMSLAHIQLWWSLYWFGFRSGSALFFCLTIIAPYLMFIPRARPLAHGFAILGCVELVASTAASAYLPTRIFVLPVAYSEVVNTSMTAASLLIMALAFTRATENLRVQVDGLRSEIAAFREMGQFTLQERIGAGGMGEVWRASHGMLARPAAVKLIRPDRLAASPEGAEHAIQRFEREAQVTAGLRSPHTVELYDFGVDDEGVFYYVMELLDGLDVRTLVTKHGALSSARTAYLLDQVCHSLREAHGVGLVHRDIKPANLIVCRYGDDADFVKVLDFGLVTLQAGQGTNEPMTMDGDVSGTPAYMAPEMVMDPSNVDERADIYAVGCVAWFMLTGRQVFTESGVMQLVMAHVNTPPPRMSELCELPVHPQLEALVMACLAKDPADRPQSAQEVRERLAAVSFDKPWSDVRAAAWWDSHHPAVATRRL